MPAPSGTLSRWAPTITVLPGSPEPVSARTLNVSRFSETVCAVTVTSPPPSRAVPAAWLRPTTGRVVAPGSPSVPATTPSSPGRPVLKTSTAEAPAAWALAAFTPKVHVPRWSRATLPAVKPAKSSASQPLVLAAGAPVVSTACTGAVTVPDPE